MPTPAPLPVVLEAHNPEWPRMAASAIQRLSALSPGMLAVHHIGSTAVPGLAAKPILDLMPLVATANDLDALRPRIEALGYVWHGELGIAGRRYCTLTDHAGVRRIQLHAFEASSPHATRHLAFRDYLLAHPETVRAYEAEKRRAAGLHPHNSHAYADEKSPWIRAAEAKAVAWYILQHTQRLHRGSQSPSGEG